MRLLSLALTLVLMTTMNGYAQQPAAQQPDQPQLSNELRLERENILLTVRVAELENQLTQLKAMLVNDRISKAAPTLIQKLQAAAPEWDVNPNTLEFTRKQAGGTAPPAQPPASSPRP
jgi:hypothetical protein